MATEEQLDAILYTDDFEKFKQLLNIQNRDFYESHRLLFLRHAIECDEITIAKYLNEIYDFSGDELIAEFDRALGKREWDQARMFARIFAENDPEDGLELACRYGYIDIVQHVLDAHPNIGNIGEGLIIAAENEYYDIVLLLVNNGANVMRWLEMMANLYNTKS